MVGKSVPGACEKNDHLYANARDGCSPFPPFGSMLDGTAAAAVNKNGSFFRNA
jgi:hypothetical protein